MAVYFMFNSFFVQGEISELACVQYVDVCVSQNSNRILKATWIYAFTACLWACDLVWVKIRFDLQFKSVANIRAFDAVNWG